MPLLGFQRQLMPKVLDGSKPFTLRNPRTDKRDPKAGETLYLYVGLRTKKAQKFAEKLCRFAVEIKLSFNLVEIPMIGQINDPVGLELFSKLDGFEDYAAFKQFHGVTPDMAPKKMRLIAWVTNEELKELLNLNL